MYLSELKIWNFRKYGIKGDKFDNSEPGIAVIFNDGVNVLVGENDSGKTTIVDAIRYVLRTQSNEYIEIDEKDFHISSGERASELKIECTFSGFSEDGSEASHFLEWAGFDEKNDYILKIWLYAKRKDNSVIQYTRAGMDFEGSYIEGDARNLLKVIYLKPLRDALTEMTHGNKSRLAQILKNLSVFNKEKDSTGKEIKHDLETDYDKIKNKIDEYFKDGKGKDIKNLINNLLSNNFFLGKDERTALISLTGSELNDILKQLDLILEENKSGLGSLNLLFIAAELLFLYERKTGLKLTLIEELEAHLHPQYQLRLIDFVQTGKKNYGQFILTTHSTTLASKIDLENLVICLKDGGVYPMGHEHTLLEVGDYEFLHRFLDATKANLFFAKGVIIVEGDAENLLLPTLAEIIDRPLHKYGVSIVNVGNTAFKRYAKIFLRKIPELGVIDIPVAIISDLDVRSIEYYEEKLNEEKKIVEFSQEFREKLNAITKEVDFGNLPTIIETKKEFEDYIKENKIVERFTGDGIMKKLEGLFDTSKVNVTEELITKIRKIKKEKLKKAWKIQNIELFLSEQWTLEYEIASSSLYKDLEKAIKMAKRLCADNTLEINKDILKIIDEEIDKEINKEISPKLSYEIFKPLNEGRVSKAITAQCLAQLLNEKKDNIKEILEKDVCLKYLRDAIYYVTEQPKNDEELVEKEVEEAEVKKDE